MRYTAGSAPASGSKHCANSQALVKLRAAASGNCCHVCQKVQTHLFLFFALA